MTDDPVVLILREAAARGRQLRLAREQAMQNETRPDDDVAEAWRPDPAIGVTATPQRGDKDIDQMNST